MDPLAAVNHLLNFAAPALALAVLLGLLARLGGRKGGQAMGWWAQTAIVFIVGCAVLAGGLVLLGRDGRMVTYGALAVACATCQWLLSRGWR